MKKQTAIIMLASLWLCVQPSRAQTNVPTVVQMSHSQLKRLEREATTAPQFNMLASYYRYQEQKYRAEAAGHALLWQIGTLPAFRAPIAAIVAPVPVF